MTASLSPSDPWDVEVPEAGTAHPSGCSTPVRRLLYDLVAEASPSGREGPVVERLRAFFEANGRTVEVDDVGNLRAPADDAVLLTSHADTVPGTPPVAVTGDRGAEVLVGRGAVDAKGSLAAMAVAAVAGGVSFAALVGEEVDSAGARHLVDDRVPPAAVINGEPTGASGIAVAYRGLLEGTFVASTTAAHGSRPEANAIDLAAEWWHRATAAVGAADRAGDAVDGITLTPTAVEGGLAADGMAVEADLTFEARVPTGTTAVDVRDRLEGTVGPGAIEWARAIPPVRADPRGPLATALRRAIRTVGLEPRHLTKSGTSDMNVLASAWGCPVVTYGPGDASTAHTPRERVELAAVDVATDVLTRVSRDRRGVDCPSPNHA